MFYLQDIIPQYGFLAKPSTLWPTDLLPPNNGRVGPTGSNPPPKPGMPDTLRPSQDRLETETANRGRATMNQEEMLHAGKADWEAPADDDTTLQRSQSAEWEPNPPKILMKDPQATPFELRSQIQFYATTECALYQCLTAFVQLI